jgi:sporulation protein YlmC with PRC-barrel domain
MKISDDLLGKEVIDESGDTVGFIKDVEWENNSNKVEAFILKEGGISAKLGLGEKKIVPYDMVDTIGEKILIKGVLFHKNE